MSNFDADALERAAKAARELEKSKNVKAVLELSKREQEMKKVVESRKAAEANAQRAAYAKEQEKVRWEEQRKTLAYQKQQEKEKEDYRNLKAEERMEKENRKARERNQELVRMQMEAEAKKEAMRRATEEEIQAERRKSDEHRAKLERENMRARALAEAEGRIKEKRDNEDVFLREIKAKGRTKREQTRVAITTFFDSLGDSLSSFVDDKQKLATTVGSLVALAAGVYVTREGARVAGRYIERKLGTPSLVRETSKSTGQYAVTKRLARMLGLEKPVTFDDVVLAGTLDTRVSRLAVSTRNTKNNNATFRNALFYGPPGTGKTMVAKRLARSAGLDYAIMTGGDIGPLGRQGVTELHKLFDWSESSSRGLLLFIDEAEAFLGSRSSTTMSEHQRNALNALLYRTGEASQNFMVVLATNRPGDLDVAVTDRMDEALLFGNPDEPSRERLLRQYFDTYVVRAGEGAKRKLFRPAVASIEVDADGLDDAYWADLAKRTDGFSGRAISKLMLSVQGAVYGQQKPVLTKDLLEDVVQQKLTEFENKASGFTNLIEPIPDV